MGISRQGPNWSKRLWYRILDTHHP